MSLPPPSPPGAAAKRPPAVDRWAAYQKIVHMKQPVSRRLTGDGLQIQVYEWPGEGPTVFLAHATGFHARCWDVVVNRLPGRHVVAIDMRGHGLSDKPEPPYPWKSFGRDVAAVGRELRLRDAIAVGHSKGGHAVTYAAALAPGVFRSLLLVDPVIMAPETYRRTAEEGPAGEHFAARRRDRWASPNEMFERFRGRLPYSAWQPAALRDYCDYGLLPAADGDGFVLACPPAIEAAVYMGSSGENGDISGELASLEIPVRVLRARPRTAANPGDFSSSPTDPGLAGRFRHGQDVSLPHLTHFIPMEDPALVAWYIRDLAR